MCPRIARSVVFPSCNNEARGRTPSWQCSHAWDLRATGRPAPQRTYIICVWCSRNIFGFSSWPCRPHARRLSCRTLSPCWRVSSTVLLRHPADSGVGDQRVQGSGFRM